MNSAEIAAAEAGAVHLRAPRLELRLLGQVLLIVGPAMAAVAMRKPDIGARCFYASLLLCLAIHALGQRPVHLLALVVGVIPPLMLFRGILFHSSIVLLLAGGAFFCVVRLPGARALLDANARLKFLIGLCTVYWLVSLLCTLDYANNMRALELMLGCTVIWLLSRYPSFLATALVAIGISAVVMGAGFLPFEGRLGYARIDTLALGNPITLGLPAALVFVLTITDSGKWLLLAERPGWRYLLNVLAGATLVMSTSRGSWIVAVVGVLVLLLFGRRAQQGHTLLSLALLGLAAGLVIASGKGKFVQDYLERTLSTEESLAKRTTGRSLQWTAFPRAMRDAPLWGYGPGSGRNITEAYVGRKLQWHSLYLHVGVETGVVGLATVLALLAGVIAGGFSHWSATRELAPLAGGLCFAVIGVSVSGMDSISGVYLGLGFLARRSPSLWSVRRAAVHDGVAAPARWTPAAVR